jgi:predicted transcriptional regulator
MPIAGTSPVDGVLGSWDITGIKESSLALKLKVADKSGNVSCARQAFSRYNGGYKRLTAANHISLRMATARWMMRR